MLGQCFLYDESDDFFGNVQPDRIVPLEDVPVFFGRDKRDYDYSYGTTYSQAGMSIHGNQEDVYLGAPGSWNWTGTFIAYIEWILLIIYEIVIVIYGFIGQIFLVRIQFEVNHGLNGSQL